MPLKQVTLKSPATSANLGPGFDVFGLALDQPSDKVILTSISREIRIQINGLSANTISPVPEKNTAGIVAKKIMTDFSIGTGLLIKIEKGIIPGKGLGSSAASAAAVAYGLNRMFNLGLDNVKLIEYAAKGEVASAGSEHADNVSATICGDFVIIKSYNPLQIVNYECPKNMEISIALPKMVTPPKKTEKARSVIPKMIPLEKLVYNVGKAAAMASGFAAGNVDLIGESMCDDVVEPARAPLIPGYAMVKENALKAGACGVAISGAGPGMLAVVNKKKADATKVALAMKEGFKSAGLDSIVIATKPGKGVSLLEIKQ